MEFQALGIGIPDRRVICVFSQRDVLFPLSIFAGNMSLEMVCGLWKVSSFSHTNSWRCFSNFGDAPKHLCWSCFEPCLRPNQTWETARFREVERQGVTQESCMGSSVEKETSSQDSSQAVCSSGQEGIYPSVYERAKQSATAQSCAGCFGVINGGVYPCCLVLFCLQW